MHLDISYDPELQKVEIIYDDAFTLTVKRNNTGKIVLSNSFDRLTDEAEHAAIRAIAE